MLKEGDKAPDFILKDKYGNPLELQFIRPSYFVLFFYPKDGTSGCTIESTEFSGLLSEFKKVGATVIGISGGNAETKMEFTEKHNLKVILVSDEDFSVSKQYGVYGKKQFMGVESMGINRTTFVLDKSRRVIKVFEKVNPEGHAHDVLEFIRGLSSAR